MLKDIDNALIETEETSQCTQLANEVSLINQLDDFQDIYKDNIGAVVMQRSLSSSFQQWIDDLTEDALPSLRTTVPIDHVAEAIRVACEIAEMPAGANLEFLINDMVVLAELFARLLKVSHVRLRLNVINNDACRSFHIDHVTARLICTYRGRGTQYKLSQTDLASDDVFEVPTGSPFIMRGATWDGDQSSGILHRSPPIEGSGETRLLFVIDPILDPLSDD